MSLPPALDAPDLFARALNAREQVWGRRIFMRGIVEFSSFCQQNCLYCGLRRDNTSLKRYRLSKAHILAAARQIKQLGMGTVVLQSGEDLSYGRDFISELIKRIKGELGLAVTLSVGERESGDITAWRQAGADRYLLKVETFSPAMHARMRPGTTVDERLNCLDSIREAGYETGSGLICGLPGQSQPMLAEELDKLNGLKLDMISLSPFICHPQTPLAGCVSAAPQDNLRALAYARAHNPCSHIPVSSALALYGNELRDQALVIACDVLMLSLTPQAVRGAYNIYPGKNLSALEAFARAENVMRQLRDNGFTLPTGPGAAWRLSGSENLEEGY